MDRWAGRVALVTGANSGIGAEIANSLSSQGMKVIGADMQINNIQSTSSGVVGSLSPFKCDLTVDAEVESLFRYIEEQFGGVDICVNCAGIGGNKSLLDEPNPKGWRRMLDINVVALAYCSKLSVDLMRKKNIDDGHIINLASMAGNKVYAVPIGHFYSVTKFGVKAFTEGLRMELREAKTKIRATSICPGFVQTDLFKHCGIPDAEREAMFSQLSHIQAKDIADCVIYIVSAPPSVQVSDITILPTEQQD